MDSSYVIDYLLKIITIHGIFFLLYFVFLRNKTSHRLNRAYLLTTLLVAFFIPVLEFSIPQESVPMLPEPTTFQWEEDAEETSLNLLIVERAAIEKPSFDYWRLVKWAYIALTAVLFLRSVFHLVILQKLKNQSEYVEKQWFKLFKTSQSHPFSFLSNVFIPKVIFGTNSFDQILEHECEHVRQYHSFDRLLLDFMVALFWFNPFIFLYRKALIEIHEFQADDAVLKKFPNSIEYQEVLFSQLSTASYSGLVSHFNFSTIKKRIVMINKRNNKRSIWAYGLAVPVTLWVILAFSGRVDTDPLVTLVDDEFTEEIIVEVPKQDANTPSISPIKEGDMVRLSSGFGMRIHPVLKERKMHLGLDLAAPIGTVIYATADGVVKVVRLEKGGYGKMIKIAHGDRFETRYAQLSAIEVKVGEEVRRGQRIGLSGSSGMSTAPHLHYEVIAADGKHQDPMKFIKDRKFAANSKLPFIKEVQAPNNLDETAEEPELIEIVEIPTDPEEEITEEPELIEVVEVPTAEAVVLQEVKVDAQEVEDLMEFAVLQEVEQPIDKVIAIDRGKLYLNTVQSGTEPLFVIDGKVAEGTDGLEPEDIESIVVLKGKSAEKVYGKRGENGVVEIETKNYTEGRKREILEEQREIPVDKVIEVLDGNLYLNTLDSDQQPLFVVDGDVVKKPLDLEPEDIESITVLKDKSAKKLYGQDGKNGVVEIKTKNKRTKTKIKEKDKEKEKTKDPKGARLGSFRVLIDAGHGGEDDGAVSPSGKLEKDISLGIAKLVKANFSDPESIEIILSRDRDVAVTIKDRVAQSKDADLMIALHTDNYSNKSESFIVPIYNDLHVEREKSRHVAKLLADEFTKAGKEAKVAYSSGYYLLKNAKCPAVMLQVGFFSNKEEDAYLSSAKGQKAVAQSISGAIEQAVL